MSGAVICMPVILSISSSRPPYGFCTARGALPDPKCLTPQILESLTREETVQLLRGQSSSFAHGISKYRGVMRVAFQHGAKWEARICRVDDSRYLSLGTFDSEVTAVVQCFCHHDWHLPH